MAIQAWPTFSETEGSLHILGSRNYPPMQQICHPSLVPWGPLCSISCQHLHSECLELSLWADGPELCRPLQQLPTQSFRLQLWKALRAGKTSSQHSPDCPVSPLHLPIIKTLPISHANTQWDSQCPSAAPCVGWRAAAPGTPLQAGGEG